MKVHGYTSGLLSRQKAMQGSSFQDWKGQGFSNLLPVREAETTKAEVPFCCYAQGKRRAEAPSAFEVCRTAATRKTDEMVMQAPQWTCWSKTPFRERSNSPELGPDQAVMMENKASKEVQMDCLDLDLCRGHEMSQYLR